MKVLRFLGILLLIIIAAVVVMGLVAPNDVKVERSIVINAPKEVVLEQMTKYRNWPNWSPWYEMDPNMEITYMGEDGEVGSGYHWKGTKDGGTGEGEIITKEIQPNMMTYHTHFKEPWESEADGYVKVEEVAGGQTRATWGFDTHTSFPWNAMYIFFDMDKMLGKDFERGMEKLKEHVESGKAGSGSMTIKEVNFPATTYATVRKEISWNEMDKFFSDAYPKLGEAVGDKITGPATGIYYTWDEANQRTEAAAAFPVSAKGSDGNGITYAEIPASKAFMAVHKGGYSASYNTHMAITEKVKAAGKEQHLVLEEYIKGPGETQDSNQYVTNIYYLIK